MSSPSGLRIVLGNGSLAGYPQAGGLWSLFLQYLLGLADLGHDVLWLELYRATGDERRDRELIDGFFARMHSWGVGHRCALLAYEKGDDLQSLENATLHGTTKEALEGRCRSSDLLLNFACALREPLLSLFKRRALVDVDPGHLQVSALDWDLGLADHDVFFTIGMKVGVPDCQVPTLGLKWNRFPPVVYLPIWEALPDPGPQAPFTSVTQWNWEEIWLGERVLSISKRQAYMSYVSLPKLTGRPFELAANIHPSDPAEDRLILDQHGWDVTDPYAVAGSVRSYRRFIARSRAELCCPKPIFRELRTGWFSDRSACYLATGRPVLAEDTGFADDLPTGDGLFAFADEDEAVSGVAEIDGNYAHHSDAARDLAQTVFNSRRVLPALLSACDNQG